MPNSDLETLLQHPIVSGRDAVYLSVKNGAILIEINFVRNRTPVRGWGLKVNVMEAETRYTETFITRKTMDFKYQAEALATTLVDVLRTTNSTSEILNLGMKLDSRSSGNVSPSNVAERYLQRVLQIDPTLSVNIDMTGKVVSQDSDNIPSMAALLKRPHTGIVSLNVAS